MGRVDKSAYEVEYVVGTYDGKVEVLASPYAEDADIIRRAKKKVLHDMEPPPGVQRWRVIR
jgi:hypothetical protein